LADVPAPVKAKLTRHQLASLGLDRMDVAVVVDLEVISVYAFMDCNATSDGCGKGVAVSVDRIYCIDDILAVLKDSIDQKKTKRRKVECHLIGDLSLSRFSVLWLLEHVASD
jgi:hypothetical protein